MNEEDFNKLIKIEWEIFPNIKNLKNDIFKEIKKESKKKK